MLIEVHSDENQLKVMMKEVGGGGGVGVGDVDVVVSLNSSREVFTLTVGEMKPN